MFAQIIYYCRSETIFTNLYTLVSTYRSSPWNKINQKFNLRFHHASIKRKKQKRFPRNSTLWLQKEKQQLNEVLVKLDSHKISRWNADSHPPLAITIEVGKENRETKEKKMKETRWLIVSHGDYPERGTQDSLSDIVSPLPLSSPAPRFRYLREDIAITPRVLNVNTAEALTTGFVITGKVACPLDTGSKRAANGVPTV